MSSSSTPHFRFILLASAAALLVAAESRANGFRNPPAGGKALGMDGGKIAFIDDATALTHNPANLVEPIDSSFHAAFTFVKPDSTYTGVGGRRGSPKGDVAILPNFYGIWPLSEDGMAAGIGLTTPFGQQTEWNRNTPFGPAAPYYAQLMLLDVNPTLAARLGDTVTVGVGANLYWSRLEMKQGFPWGGVLGDPLLPDGTARLEGDGMGAGANVGITWQFAERQRLAATYRSGFDVDYEGDFRVSNIPDPLAPVVAGRSDFETQIRFPNIATIGYGIELTDSLRLGADIEWVEFSRYSELPIDLGRNNAAGLFPPSLPQNWKDIWTVGAAAEWQYDDNSVLWLSYKFMETPIPSQTYSPIIVDADRHAFGVGLGHRVGSHLFSYAYQINVLEDRQIRDNLNPAVNGNYESVSHLIALSYQYQF